jgi:hypothetical protein
MVLAVCSYIRLFGIRTLAQSSHSETVCGAGFKPLAVRSRKALVSRVPQVNGAASADHGEYLQTDTCCIIARARCGQQQSKTEQSATR